MRIVKSLVIAFSIYSKIPVMQFAWKEEDMKYMLCFFPWIGAVIGGLIYLWGCFCKRYEVGELCYTLIGAAIPLVITGGFHVDGFMDTMDAFHSYQPKERKLDILKDSHIGAFAVIMFALYGLIYLAAFSEIKNEKFLAVFCAGFFLSRALSGIGVVSFHAAKKEGMLYQFADSAHRRSVKALLYLQSVLCIGFMVVRAGYEGVFIVLSAFVAFGYYYYRSKKELGGITGDTAGCFVVVCEACMGVATALCDVVN